MDLLAETWCGLVSMVTAWNFSCGPHNGWTCNERIESQCSSTLEESTSG